MMERYIIWSKFLSKIRTILEITTKPSETKTDRNVVFFIDDKYNLKF